MRIFISAGEPSGDLHGANLIRALQEREPGAAFVGFGGDRMQAAGCNLLYPMCQLAVMWFARVLARAHIFLSLLSKADRYFRHHRPDAVVLIDFPGFNWWIARRARFHGIPVFYFVPPQLWGWGGWRVKKMQRFVDHVLCVLPFEETWYRTRGVQAHFVGHPYFDELHRQTPDNDFLHRVSTAHPGQPVGGAHPTKVIGLLPGSRTQEVERNFGSMVRAAAIIHRRHPDVRFLVACFRDKHREIVQKELAGKNLPIEPHVGRTPEIIAAAHACIAVSGSVGLELLFRGKPSAVIYRIRPFELKVCNRFKTSRYISLVNLLAGKELFPEFLVDHCPAEALAATVLGWLDDANGYHALCDELLRLRSRVAAPGACARAADFILHTLRGSASAERRQPLRSAA